MRVALFGLGVLAATFSLAAAAEAQNYPWCSQFADGAGTNCGFSSYEQCMATARGSGGYCEQNNMYKPAGAAPHAARGKHRHRPR